ncbi:MAG TPA: hypothetical protein VM425_00400 [Myxococcota bacterium]|nr:hypothetical protein [Myxococcota bacterium]
MACFGRNACFSKILCLLAATACLVTAAPATAEVQCAEPLHTVSYDGCLLPDDPNQVDPWTIDPGSHGEPFIDNCQLVIPVVDPMDYFGYRRYDDAFEAAELYAMQARVRAEDFYMQGTYVNVSFGISDGLKNASIDLTHNTATGEMRVAACDQSPSCTSIAIDWSSYHDYRIEVWKEGTARFFVDGQMFHEVDYDQLRNSNIPPNLSVFGGAESISYWDSVSYETCGAAIPPTVEPPPIEEQIANMQDAADQLDAPRAVRRWIQWRLERTGRIEDSHRQNRAFYRIGRQVFMMKFVGLVADDAAELETLIDFARDTLVPGDYRHEGYLGRLQVTSQLAKNAIVVPEKENARVKLFVDVKPSGQHVANNGRYGFALAARVGVVDAGTGQLVWLGEQTIDLPDRLSPRMAYRTMLDFEWDGVKLDGSQAVAGESFFMDANVTYLQFETANPGNIIRPDEVAGWGPINPVPVPLQEVWVTNHFAGKATKVHLEYFGPTEAGSYYIHTDDLNSDSTDPALYLVGPDYLGTLVANDECDTEMDHWRTRVVGGVVIHYPVNLECRDENGTIVECPYPYGSRNACLHVDVDSSDLGSTLHLFAMSSGNENQGTGSLSIWKKIEHRNYNEYRRVQRSENVSFGGTHIRFMNGWQVGSEIDAIIPSPERSTEIKPGFMPAAVPTGIFLMDPLVSVYQSGNGMAGGARLSDLQHGTLGQIVVESDRRFDAPAGDREWAVDVYLNDVGHGDTDGDGLGTDLETALGTSPANRDTDGDGLWDGFEVLGIRAGGSSYQDQALPTWGASPLHKDVFVETDFYSPDGKPLEPPEAVFAAGVASQCSGGPGYLENPDGRDGFSIHVDNGHDDVEVPPTSAYGDWGGVGPVTPDEGDHANCDEESMDYLFGYYSSHLSAIRQGIFHYAVGADSSGGRSHLGQPTLCFVSKTGLIENQPGKNFIHELGHNFGLRHWGKTEPGSNYENKPHYVSLMNYRYKWDDEIRFSEGERRYIIDGNGAQVEFVLDPAAIDESTKLLDIAFGSAFHVFLEGHPNWYETWHGVQDDVPWVKIDWNGNGQEDTATKADFITGSSYNSQVVVDDFGLRFGPQLVEHGDDFFVFYVREGEQDIRYSTWREEGCDPESLSPQCGGWRGNNLVDVPTNVDSDMSGVSLEIGKFDRLFLFYKDNTNRLCVVCKKPVVFPGYPEWTGPYCGEHEFYSPPESVVYGDQILVFGVGAPTGGEEAMGKVKVVAMDPEHISDVNSWTEYPVQVTTPAGPTEDLWSNTQTSVALALDPGADFVRGTEDDSLLGISIDEVDEMRLFTGPLEGTVNQYEKLDDSKRWLDHPGGETKLQKTTYRPALEVERLPSGVPKWTLWYYVTRLTLPGFPPVRGFDRLTSSYEVPPDTSDGDRVTLFSRNEYAVGFDVHSENVKNVSLAFYHGKLRGSVAYDDWTENAPGFIFLPLADGIFHASLMDVNDVEIIGDNMGQAATMCYRRLLFDGMSPDDLQIIGEANHVNLDDLPLRECLDDFSTLQASCPP